MATIDDLKNKASGAAQTAAKTAKYVASVSKKRLAILNEQEKIRRNYTKLGKVYYKDYVTDEEADEAEYRPLCESISDSFRRINALREEIAQARDEYSGEADGEESTEEYDFVPFTEEAPAAEEPKAEEPSEE